MGIRGYASADGDPRMARLNGEEETTRREKCMKFAKCYPGLNGYDVSLGIEADHTVEAAVLNRSHITIKARRDVRKSGSARDHRLGEVLGLEEPIAVWTPKTRA
jgi:hypothetical protein